MTPKFLARVPGNTDLPSLRSGKQEGEGSEGNPQVSLCELVSYVFDIKLGCPEGSRMSLQACGKQFEQREANSYVIINSRGRN